MVLARQGAILAVLSMWAMGRPCLLRLLPTDSRRTALPSLSGKWPGKLLPHPGARSGFGLVLPGPARRRVGVGLITALL
jgi:hypothetical protein